MLSCVKEVISPFINQNNVVLISEKEVLPPWYRKVFFRFFKYALAYLIEVFWFSSQVGLESFDETANNVGTSSLDYIKYSQVVLEKSSIEGNEVTKTITEHNKKAPQKSEWIISKERKLYLNLENDFWAIGLLHIVETLEKQT